MVSALLPLRPYQREALDAVKRDFVEGGIFRTAIVLPTGGGKTVCFAHQAKEWLDEHPADRVLVLVHTDELVEQSAKKIRDIAPHLVVGIVKASRNEVTADVIVASVQTLAKAKRLMQVRSVSLIIVDECDLSAAPSYQNIMRGLGAFDETPKAKVVGYTATFYRADGKPLGRTYESVAFTRDISWFIRKGYLIPPRGKAVEVPDLDLSKVKATKADYREGELGEALAESLAPELVAKAINEHAADRKVLAFFPTVASAYVFAAAIEDAGIEARVIHGGLSTQDRRDALAWHRRGTVLVNCMILTVGYDDPEVDCIVIGRPTKSKRLYVQIVGRGLRVDPSRPYDEQDLLLLDVVGANRLHDLRSIVDLSDRPLKETDTEGKTLIELEDEFDAGEGVEPDEVTFYEGEVVTRDFDPLGAANRSKVWLRTDGGTYFVPAGTDAYVFIMEYPNPGRYSVAWCTKTGTTRLYECKPATGTRFAEDEAPQRFCQCGNQCRGRAVGMTQHADLDLELAMTWAEDLAVDMGADTMNLANKRASWRSRQPTERTVKLAESLGIKLLPKYDPISGARLGYKDNAGKVSDLITKIVGTRRIDPLVARVQGGSK